MSEMRAGVMLMRQLVIVMVRHDGRFVQMPEQSTETRLVLDFGWGACAADMAVEA